MACEIASPGGGEEYDKKMVTYVEAGIEWYLIVAETPAGFRGELFQLDGGKYACVAQAPPAGVLTLPEPFAADIELRELS